MSTLLRYVFEWLGTKLLTLLGIIAILLIAFWFRSEWSEISKLLQAAHELGGKISEKETSIHKLRQEVEQHGADAKAALADLDLKEQAAKAAWGAAAAAKQVFQAADAQVTKLDYFMQDKPFGGYYKAKIVAKDTLATKSGQAHEHAARLQQAVDESKEKQKSAPWVVSQTKLDADKRELETLQNRREELLESTANTPSQKLALAIWNVLPSALWILAGVILLPPGIKAVLYFCVAPVADKVAPIKIVPAENNPPAPQLLASGVSLDVKVKGSDELLAHPDYLQSSAKSAKKLTKWFLNHRLPFSSLASGMCLLTRIRAQEGQSETAKISATKDPLGEVGLIDLPEGAAMVLYPRSLVAVVKPQDRDIAITRRWRLKNLHSWLTLQFRYLVFHGPCQIVVKGCRGVCVEKPAADKPRLINQAATIGFSANLNYSNTRSEVFLSYLRGKDDLFNDLFGGESGVFIYEEMPDLRRKSGLTGRGIEGMTDALLKAFGV